MCKHSLRKATLINKIDETEREFIKSWINIKAFYDRPDMRLFLGHELADLMIKLIDEMQAAGYNKCLRAGQALHELILSRSQEHGKLWPYYICFQPEYGISRIDGDEKTYQSLKVSYHVKSAIAEEFEEDAIAFTSRIERLLKKLSEQPIT